jgi:hypothetical protein
MRTRTLFLLFSLLFTAACNSAVSSVPSTQVPASAQTSVPTATTLAATTAPTDTPMPTPTDTPLPATATVTLSPAASAMIENLVNKGTFGIMVHSIRSDGPILKSWHDVPLLPQATNGKEIVPTIYMYGANATFDQARQFYTYNSQSLGLTMTKGPESTGTGVFAGQSYYLYSSKLVIVIDGYPAPDNTVQIGISFLP